MYSLFATSTSLCEVSNEGFLEILRSDILKESWLMNSLEFGVWGGSSHYMELLSLIMLLILSIRISLGRVKSRRYIDRDIYFW